MYFCLFTKVVVKMLFMILHIFHSK